jgi:hypothetical protein
MKSCQYSPLAEVLTIYIPRNLQMRTISYRVVIHKAGRACQEQTLKLIGPIHKLQMK